MNHDNIFDSELHNKAASNSHRTDITETINIPPPKKFILLTFM